MRKLWRRIAFCGVLAATIWCGTVIADRQKLREELIRIHVVANSDSAADQSVKLLVRDAVLESIHTDLQPICGVEQARAYLMENLPKIQEAANEALTAAGCDMSAVATLCAEAFDRRTYDTFSLPSGVYEALRITIGAGEGENWWCVAFPEFCIPTTTQSFETSALEMGFSAPLVHSLAQRENYEIRFFFLDALGKIENIFFDG